MKTAAQAASKWTASTQQGQQTWVDNLANTSKPIVDAAINQRAVLQANFAAATAPGGRWETNLRAVGDAGIKAAARDKANNYGTGVQQGAPKFASAIAKIIQYEQAGLQAIYSMPSGTIAASKARATAWIDYMHAGKGQLGA